MVDEEDPIMETYEFFGPARGTNPFEGDEEPIDDEERVIRDADW